MKEPHCYHPGVLQTPNGVRYLTESGVALMSMPVVDMRGAAGFLDGFDPELDFPNYLNDDYEGVTDDESIIKFAGQLCYMSFSEERTKNADRARYFDNIKSSGHGSVLEHANFGFLIYGVSRSFTHELVRHRVGVAFSQVSQRYVDGKKLRFVERPEFQGNEVLHAEFVRYIEAADAQYNQRAAVLLETMQFDPALSKRDRRKMVNQAARSCLPNETEAPIFMTGNVRSWRHVLEMRCSGPAEREIRDTTYKIYKILKEVTPLFDDYEVVLIPQGGYGLVTKYKKV